MDTEVFLRMSGQCLRETASSRVNSGRVCLFLRWVCYWEWLAAIQKRQEGLTDLFDQVVKIRVEWQLFLGRRERSVCALHRPQDGAARRK